MAISWIDVEATGTDSVNDKLLEISVVITDNKGNHPCEYEGPSLVKYSKKEIDEMKYSVSRKVYNMHEQSGLWNDLYQANHDNSDDIMGIDQSISDFINDTKLFSGIFDPYEDINFGGNTVILDRQLVKRDLTITNSMLSHGNVDTHVLKTVASNNSWLNTFKRELSFDRSHRALDDVYEAIEMYKFYCQQFGLF